MAEGSGELQGGPVGVVEDFRLCEVFLDRREFDRYDTPLEPGAEVLLDRDCRRSGEAGLRRLNTIQSPLKKWPQYRGESRLHCKVNPMTGLLCR